MLSQHQPSLPRVKTKNQWPQPAAQRDTVPASAREGQTTGGGWGGAQWVRTDEIHRTWAHAGAAASAQGTRAGACEHEWSHHSGWWSHHSGQPRNSASRTQRIPKRLPAARVLPAARAGSQELAMCQRERCRGDARCRRPVRPRSQPLRANHHTFVAPARTPTPTLPFLFARCGCDMFAVDVQGNGLRRRRQK